MWLCLWGGAERRAAAAQMMHKEQDQMLDGVGAQVCAVRAQDGRAAPRQRRALRCDAAAAAC